MSFRLRTSLMQLYESCDEAHCMYCTVIIKRPFGAIFNRLRIANRFGANHASTGSPFFDGVCTAFFPTHGCPLISMPPNFEIVNGHLGLPFDVKNSIIRGFKLRKTSRRIEGFIAFTLALILRTVTSLSSSQQRF